METCFHSENDIEVCDAGNFGVPTDKAEGYGKYVASVATVDGVITATSKDIKKGDTTEFTYTLTPVFNGANNENLGWNAGGTCVEASLCKEVITVEQ